MRLPDLQKTGLFAGKNLDSGGLFRYNCCIAQIRARAEWSRPSPVATYGRKSDAAARY
jgi:hypothetical protein